MAFLGSLFVRAQSQPELRVAAAADLQPVLPALADAYEHKTGVRLKISYGASATLAQQAQNGAPFDIFLSADFLYPEQLVAAGLADGREPTPYARGTLVLWARKDSGLQPITLDSLNDPRVQRIAIANELHAPYGRAAAAALRKLGMYDKLSPKFVVAENIAQAAQFAESGNAQLALISLTIANSPHYMETGSYVRVPKVAYPEIRQCAVVLRNSPNQTAAHDFLNWLLSTPVQAGLRQFGLEPAQ